MEDFKKELIKCIRCGNCMAKCPIYQAELKESSVARGKISLIKEFSELKDKNFIKILFNCLICKSCITVCPSGVRFDSIIIEARKKIVEEKGLSLIKKIIFSSLKKPSILNSSLWFASKLSPFFTTPLQKEQIQEEEMFKKAKNILKLFSERFDENFILPNFDSKDLRSLVSPDKILKNKKEAKGKILFFTGCSVNYFFPFIGKSIIKILEMLNFEVKISEKHYCCGMPVMVHGDLKTAKELAKKNLEIFENFEPEWIITPCASCTSALKEDWALLLKEDKKDFEQYSFWKERVYEFSEFLIKIAKENFLKLIKKAKKENDKKKKITYHDPCHLKNSLKIIKEPREVLQSLPGVEFIEMQDNECCGSGGSYHLTHKDTSLFILRNKVESIKNTGAEIVITTCPACILQLAEGSFRFKANYKVRHLATFIETILF